MRSTCAIIYAALWCLSCGSAQRATPVPETPPEPGTSEAEPSQAVAPDTERSQEPEAMSTGPVDPVLLRVAAALPELAIWHLVPLFQIDNAERSLIGLWHPARRDGTPGTDSLDLVGFERAEGQEPRVALAPTEVRRNLREVIDQFIPVQGRSLRDRGEGVPLAELVTTLAEQGAAFGEAARSSDFPAAVDAATAVFRLFHVDIGRLYDLDLDDIAELLLVAWHGGVTVEHHGTEQSGATATVHLTLKMQMNGESDEDEERVPARQVTPGEDRWVFVMD